MKEKLNKGFNRLSHKQKLGLVLGLLCLFVLIDAFYIVRGFTGKDGSSGLDIRHIKPLPLPKSPKEINQSLKILDHEKEPHRDSL